jgi:hyperosmotically inducible protein
MWLLKLNILEEIVKKILFIPVICILCASCNSNSSNPNGNSNDYSNGNNQMQSQPSDWEITANVKKNLMSDGSLSSSARMISVTTNNGVVTLTGTVASKEESRKVVKIVKNVPGVTSVDNQLTVSNS